MGVVVLHQMLIMKHISMVELKPQVVKATIIIVMVSLVEQMEMVEMLLAQDQDEVVDFLAMDHLVDIVVPVVQVKHL